MSTKTMKQRIALVAVSALTAGILSVATAPVANSAALASSYNWGDAAGSPYDAEVGFCFQNDTTDVLEVRYDRFAGAGDAAINTADLFLATADTQLDNATTYVYFKATGTGYFTTAAADASATEALIAKSSDEKTLTIGNTTTGADLDMPNRVVWKQTAVGKTTIDFYSVVIATGAQTLLETFTLLANTSCTTGGYATTYSGSQLQTSSTALTTATGAADVSAAVNVEYATGISYLALFLRDAYGEAVTDSDSFLTAKTTGGCTVSWAAGDLSSTRSSVVATSGITNEVLKIFTAGATANSCGITVDYNSTVVATKTVNFRGEASKVVALLMDSAIKDSSVTAGYYDVLDAAGVRLSGFAPAATDLTGTLAGAAITFGASTASGTQGAITIDTVDSNRGTGTFKIRATKSDGTYVYSDVITVLVSGGMSTYALSLDKATYSPGEIITVTISAKDSKGAIVADATALGGTVSFTIAGASVLGSAPAPADEADNGKWTYKYTAGIIEGDWAANFSSTSSATETAKQTTYKIAAKNPGVSNADVLKSIVALIASINKQIQALQKLILKR